MKRTIATLATTVLLAAGTIAAAPTANAAEGCHSGDVSTLPCAVYNYNRVVSIGEGLAHRLAVESDRADAAEARADKLAGADDRADRLQTKVTQLDRLYDRADRMYHSTWNRAHRLETRVANQSDRVAAKNQKIRSLRVALRKARR